jgi:hypothetical protein
MLNFIQRRWKPLGIVLLCGLSLLFLGTSYVIGQQVQDVVSQARQSGYEGDVIPSLLSLVLDEEAPLSERNSAIWALGQLGASEALTTLEAFHTGEDCDHTHDLCQHELGKAIQQCQGARNIGALVWRHGELAGVTD